MVRIKGLAAAAALTVTLAAPAVAAPAKSVRLGDNYFSPSRLRLSPGSRVTWHWIGGSGIPHNVKVAKGPARFSSTTIGSGSYSHVFTRRGTYRLYCSLHPEMKETVVVR